MLLSLRRALPLLIVWISLAPGARAASQASTVVSPSDPGSVQRAIDEAIRLRLPKLTIPPGTYEVPPGLPPEKAYNFHLRVTGAKDLEIDATGVTLIFPARKQNSMAFIDCENVTFRGATLKRKVGAVSQGVIEAIRNGGKSIDIRIDAGYPADIDDHKLWSTFWTSVYSMDRSRWLAHYRASTPNVKVIGPNLIRAEMADDETTIGFKLQVGQPLAWRGQEFDDVHVRNCTSMKFIGVTVAGGAGMCYHEFGGNGGNLYKNCRVTYGDLPPGATQKPLFSSAADGFHSGGAQRGPIIEDSLFEGCDDDGIAVHGVYACVVENTAGRLVLWCADDESFKRFGQAGDALHFVDPAGAPKATAKIASLKQLSGYTPPAGYAPLPLYRLFSDVKAAKFVEITLDKPVPAAAANWLVSNDNTTGNGYVIRNTIVRGNTARGIMVKGSDGLIEGCTLENNARAAIEMMPEHILWPESGYVRNVTIRNNTIRNVSLNRQEGILRHAGSIAIYAYRPEGGYVAGGGHQNILIENNTFEDNNGPNLLVTSANGVTVRGNQFIRPMKVPSTFGTAKGINPSALLFFTQCSNLLLEHNLVFDAGDGLKKLIDTTTTASGNGLSDGVEQKH